MMTDLKSQEMKKDILFLVKNELNWELNFEQAKKVFGDQQVQLVHGKSTINESFQHCAEIVSSPLFVLIDGDNFVYEHAKNAVNSCLAPTVFFSHNKFFVTYGHGGIKILDPAKIKSFEYASDITSKLGLKVDNTVLSFHDFAFSEFNEWKTIFKELLKLFLWGNAEYLNQWLKHDLPKQIFRIDIKRFMQTATLDSIQKTIFSESILRSIYENRNRCNL